MRRSIFISVLALGQSLVSQDRFDVSSLSEFNSALNDASAGDSIVWEAGVYSDIFMDITMEGLIVTAKPYGSVIFEGASKAEIDADNVTFSGFQYLGGNIGTDHVMRIWGSDVLITQINIADYTSYKYLIIDEDSRRATVSYSNFENRLNLDDQNILSILVDNSPGYHKVQYCSFKNFEGTGNDLGIEPVRIGVSSQAHLDSRSIIEYCYFTNCDGDGELISNKAAQNVIRYNTFKDNSKAELVLRHGDEAIVYGNFFINNMGGVRIREGSNHYIFNNYFEGLDSRAIYLQNESSDPLSDIHIYHNTIINSQEVRLGGSGSHPPQNVTFANNIFSDPQDDLFQNATGNETWIDNISFGSLGITRPSGLTNLDPKLSINSEDFLQPENDSPVIGNAGDGYPAIPLFTGLQYDNEISLDLMKESRSGTITDRAIGASEYSSTVNVQPHATENNTGPIYLTDPQPLVITIGDVEGGDVDFTPDGSYSFGSTVTATAVPATGFLFSNWTGDLSGSDNPISFTITSDMTIGVDFMAILSASETNDWVVYPNPGNSILRIQIDAVEQSQLAYEILSSDGKRVFHRDSIQVQTDFDIDISDLSPGVYFLKVKDLSPSNEEGAERIQKFVKE